MSLTTPVPPSAVFVAPAKTAAGTGAIAANRATRVVPAACRSRTTALTGIRLAEVPVGPEGPAAPSPRSARISTGPAGAPALRRTA